MKIITKVAGLLVLATLIGAPEVGMAHSMTDHNHGSVSTRSKTSKATKKKVAKANSGKKVRKMNVKEGDAAVFK